MTKMIIELIGMMIIIFGCLSILAGIAVITVRLSLSPLIDELHAIDQTLQGIERKLR